MNEEQMNQKIENIVKKLTIQKIKQLEDKATKAKDEGIYVNINFLSESLTAYRELFDLENGTKYSD